MIQAETIINDVTRKSFLWINLEGGNQYVEKISCTDSEIEDCELNGYDIHSEETYSLLTSSSYVGERKIKDMEIGDIVEIDSDTTFMRIG